MTTSSSTINLLKIQEDVSPEYESWIGRLTLVGYILLGITILFGILVGLLFIVLGQRMRGLSDQKTRLTNQLERQEKTEVTLRAFKHRIGVVDRVLESQVDWSRILDLVGQIGPSATIVGLDIQDNEVVHATFSLDRIDQAVSVAQAFGGVALREEFNDPKIQNFTVSEDGSVELSISFARRL
ncbi:MAG: hypothetical protein Q7S76_01055 [bacterium]|nr:hypothetical protein [bacterium]